MNVLVGKQNPPAAQRWAPDAKLVVICMACHREFSEPTETCPDCHISVSHVRMCPDCHKWISAVHTKCIYCSRSFVLDPHAPADGLDGSASASLGAGWHWKRVRHLVVSAIVFLLVFSGLLYLTRVHRKPAAPRPHKMGTTYALRRAPIFSSSSLTGAAISHVAPAEVVTVMAFASPGLPEHWLQITGHGVTGYVAMRDFAPPRPLDPEEGYAILRSVLLVIDEPKVIPLADDGVAYYQHAFPASQHGEELAWLVAERAQRLSTRAADSQLILIARKRLQEIAAANGAMAEDARKQLAELRDVRATNELRRPKRVSGGMQVLGGSLSQSSGILAHRVVILQPTEVLVQVTQLSKMPAGTVLPGQVARDVLVGKDIAVPAGSECRLKVVRSAEVESAGGKTSAIVQLIGLNLGNRRLAVNAAPVEMPVASGDAAPSILRFKISAPLVISN